MSEDGKFKEETAEFLAEFKGERHNHIWGYELWIENNEKYCNKLLILHKGFESSWHYHERKDETFVILEGQVSPWVDYTGLEGGRKWLKMATVSKS
jgi:mannose-6-phosphate isomerase-like protein (cupin superfamily)